MMRQLRGSNAWHQAGMENGWHNTENTEKGLEKVVAAALEDRTADNVEQVTIAISISSAKVTLRTVDAARTLSLPSARLSNSMHARHCNLPQPQTHKNEIKTNIRHSHNRKKTIKTQQKKPETEDRG